MHKNRLLMTDQIVPGQMVVFGSDLYPNQAGYVRLQCEQLGVYDIELHKEVIASMIETMYIFAVFYYVIVDEK